MAVKRNITRFPEDFIFQLTTEEFLILQNARSRWGGTRKPPYAFTEQGVAMLSGLLNSNRAIDVNIQIMRAFVRIREMLLTHKDILHKIEELERKSQEHDYHISAIFENIRELLTPEPETKKQIGFRP